MLNLVYNQNTHQALTGVAPLGGHHPSKQKVPGSIPSRGTCLGCRFGPWTRGNRSMFLSHLDVSLPLFLPPLPSL